MNVIEKISTDLNVPLNLLEDAILNSRKHVKCIKIPKKDGTSRKVYQPSKKLKIIQYWLDENIYKKMKIHDSAMAYQKNKSIKKNAIRHRGNKYVLKLDFKDFFPSIKFSDVSPYIKDWINTASVQYNENDLLDTIRKSCFYVKDILPIGYPTSPIISNIVMYDFDLKITMQLSDKDKHGTAYYTRYADDMIFSTNLKGGCTKIKNMVMQELDIMESPKLTLNESKTRFVSTSGGTAIITGLRVCYDGHITIHRRYKDKIRLLISLYEKGCLSEENINSLKGHLSYVREVDSLFYTKIQKKHFVSLSKIIG